MIGCGIAVIILIGTIVTLSVRTRRLTDELEGARTSVRLITEHRIETRIDRDNWKSTATALKADIDTWQDDYSELKAVAQAVRAENTSLRAHALDLSVMVRTLTKKLAELGAAADELIDKRYGNGQNGITAPRVKGRFVAPKPVVQLRDVVAEMDKPARDWSVPQAFPTTYEIPKGINVVVIADDREESNTYFRSNGMKGITTQESNVPFCDWEDGKNYICMGSHHLAPVNPTDHPEHPEFNPTK